MLAYIANVSVDTSLFKKGLRKGASANICVSGRGKEEMETQAMD